MNRVAIKKFLQARGITRATEEIARTTGLCMRSASLKMQGKRPWTCGDIEAMRNGWGLTDEQTVEFFIKSC